MADDSLPTASSTLWLLFRASTLTCIAFSASSYDSFTDACRLIYLIYSSISVTRVLFISRARDLQSFAFETATRPLVAFDLSRLAYETSWSCQYNHFSAESVCRGSPVIDLCRSAAAISHLARRCSPTATADSRTARADHGRLIFKANDLAASDCLDIVKCM